MVRTDILNHLIDKFNYRTYLEIGVDNPALNFDLIQSEFKIGVDPFAKRADIIPTTSDDFFEALLSHHSSNNIPSQIYDLIFIDGLHHAEQVERDINNALECLNENGSILVHDVNPATEDIQKVPRQTNEWTGDCWKAWVKLRAMRDDISMFVIDAEYGNGIIRKGSQTRIAIESKELSYQQFSENREQWLNMISTNEFETWLKCY